MKLQNTDRFGSESNSRQAQLAANPKKMIVARQVVIEHDQLSRIYSLFLVIGLIAAFAYHAAGQSAIDGFHADVNNSVWKVRTHYDKVYVSGGLFASVNGTAKSHLARLNFDGNLDTTYNPNPNGAIQNMAFSGIKLVVVGSFSSIGGGASSGIARLNYDGTNDGTFTAAISGAGALAVQSDGKIIVGGQILLFKLLAGQKKLVNICI